MSVSQIMYPPQMTHEKKFRSKCRQAKCQSKLSKNEKKNFVKENYKKKSNYKSSYNYLDWNKENQVDYYNFDKSNKFSFAEKKLFNVKTISLSNQEESFHFTKPNKVQKTQKKTSFDKTEDSSNKTSNSSSDEKDFNNDIQSSKHIQKNTIHQNIPNQNIDEPFNKYNKIPGNKNIKIVGQSFAKRENTEILNIQIKVSQNHSLIFKLRRYDDLFQTVQLFCEINQINQNLVKPIILKVLEALNQIYSAINAPLNKRDVQLLQQIKNEDF